MTATHNLLRLTRSRDRSLSGLRRLRARAIKINLARILQSAVREGLVRAPVGNAYVHFPPYLLLRASAFHRYEALWQSEDSDLEALTTREASSWLRTSMPDLPDGNWQEVSLSFRQSVIQTLINLSLALTTTLAMEENSEGHNIYPFPALRSGLSVRQAIAVNNSCRTPVLLPLYEVPNAVYSSNELPRFEDCNQTAYGLADSEDTLKLIPVHPWQLEVSQVFKRSLGTWCRRTTLAVPAIPLVSLRTFRILKTGFDVKLPIDVTITSSRRLIYQMYLQNAVAISQLLDELATLGELPPSIGFQRDVATITVPDLVTAPHLCAIIRAPMPLADDEQLIPGVDLWYGPTRSHELLQGLNRASVEEFWHRYCEVVIGGTSAALLRHGIALEPHLQNVTISFKGHLPVRVLVRDLDHAILDRDSVEGRLQLAGVGTFPLTWSYMPPFEEGIARFAHALFHAHLGEALLTLSRMKVGSEATLLAIALKTLMNLKDGLSAERSILRFDQLVGSLDKVRALLTMRLAETEDSITIG